MKGVILAGGFGTRLQPLTHIVNKHLLPVYDRPVVLYPLGTLRESGVRDIVLVSEESHLGQFEKFLKSGEEFGVRLEYAAQEGAGGIAAALSCARGFVGGENCAVILGDNVFERNFKDDVAAFRAGAKIFLKKVRDPRRFGVPVFASASIATVEEKPASPKSNWAVTGFYLFDYAVFEAIANLKPSARGELEITDAVNSYAHRGALAHGFVDGFWIDAGTFASLHEASLWTARRRHGEAAREI